MDKMSDNKPREFWVLYNEKVNPTDMNFDVVFTSAPDTEDADEFVHVIEASPVLADMKKLVECLKEVHADYIEHNDCSGVWDLSYGEAVLVKHNQYKCFKCKMSNALAEWEKTYGGMNGQT